MFTGSMIGLAQGSAGLRFELEDGTVLSKGDDVCGLQPIVGDYSVNSIIVDMLRMNRVAWQQR